MVRLWPEADVAAAVGFVPMAAATWGVRAGAAWTAAVLAGLELLSLLVASAAARAPRIPVQGRALETLAPKDYAFVAFNKMTTAAFAYHMLHFSWESPDIPWALADLTWANTGGALLVLFVLYDLTYTLFHRFLHAGFIYPYIHKHHHQQHAPSRGNTDAVNVHPVEFVLGEYNHLLVLWATPLPPHFATVVVFVVLGGVLASLNHTRADLHLGPIYDVKAHDAHHRLPDTNFGQYSMLWDRIFGYYVPYTVSEKAIQAAAKQAVLAREAAAAKKATAKAL